MILITLEPPIGSATLDAQEQADLIAGLYYVNIHSNDFPDGEISGIIKVVENVPAASTWGLVVMLVLILSAGTILMRSRLVAGVEKA